MTKNRRSFLKTTAFAVAAPAIIRSLSALAYDSPTVRFNVVPGWTIAEQATWQWFDETGTLQGTAAGQSTQPGPSLPPLPDPLTTMLQGAINYAVNGGWRFECTGESYNTSTGGCPFLDTWATIVFPSGGDMEFVFRNTIWLMRPSDGGDGALFDSSEIWRFLNVGGEIIYRGASTACHLWPRTRMVVDSNLSINSAHEFDFGSVTVQSGGWNLPVGQGSAIAAIRFNATAAPINVNDFKHGQVSGNNVAQYGIYVDEPIAGSTFQKNKIDGGYVVNCTAGCILIGQTGANSAAMMSNTWKEHYLAPNNAGATGFNTFGQYDIIEIPLIQGPANRGACFEPQSVGNRYCFAAVSGCTTPILNAGTGNSPFC